MARTLRDAKLDSREARSKLKPRGKPYYRTVEPGLALGYRKLSGRPGTWCKRKYVGDQTYEVETLKGAVADDYSPSDGHSVLSFAQAQKAVLAQKPKPRGAITVNQALDDYVEFLTHNRRTAKDSGYRIDAFMRPTLGDIPVAELTTEQLRRWLSSVASTPKRVRSAKGQAPQHAKADTDDAKRKRRVSANRMLTILRAALTMAWRAGKVASDTEWRRVERFRGVDEIITRFLSADECRRLVNACPPDFRRLVLAALLTGCRFGELINLLVGDFHKDSATLSVRTSKSGKPRSIFLTVEAQKLFAGWCVGRGSGETLLRRADGGAWKKADQGDRMRAACKRAGIVPAVNFHNLRHSHASALALKGVPLQVIGEALGHSDGRMTKRYAHIGPSYVGDTIRANALVLDTAGSDDKVTALPARR